MCLYLSNNKTDSPGRTKTKEDSTGGIPARLIVVIAVAVVIVVILITVSVLRWRGFISHYCHLDSCWHSLVEGLRSNSKFGRHFGGNENLSMKGNHKVTFGIMISVLQSFT